MVGFNLEVANSVLEKGGQWGLALMREDCMEFMNNPPCTVPIMALLGVMNDLWIIVHGSIIHPKKFQSSANRVANGANGANGDQRRANQVEITCQICVEVKAGAEH